MSRPSRLARIQRPMRLASRLATLVAALFLTTSAFAAEPVRQLTVHVNSFYASGAKPEDPPKVAVDPAYDSLLMSRNAADIRKVRDAIAANPDMVTPITLMVLATRLYDVGLRDDAVFWFYVARDRYFTVDAVLDTRSLALVGTALAVDGFTVTAGAGINSYAFCDIPKQQAQAIQAIDWVAKHPYRLLESPDMPSEVADRNEALGAALMRLRADADAETAFLAKPANLAEMKTLRVHNEADARFCWK